MGTFPAEKTSFTFSLPVHPVWEIQAIYNQDGLRPLSWNFDRERGTVQVEIMTERVPEWSVGAGLRGLYTRAGHLL